MKASGEARYTRVQMLVAIIGAVLTTAVVLGGLAIAGASTTPNKYYACNKNGVVAGAIHINKAPTCPSGQKVVLWNQAGVNGAKGATGATGPSTNCIGYPRSEIDWSGCELGSANLSGQTLLAGNLTNADLGYSNMSNVEAAYANFTGAQLRYANLTNADLASANLTNAGLYNANLTGANIVNVTWSHTLCPDLTYSDSNGTSPQSCAGHGGGL